MIHLLWNYLVKRTYLFFFCSYNIVVLCMEIDYEDIKYLDNLNIIDVRDHYLYERGHLKGSKNIPLRVLRTMSERYLSIDKTYYLICETGFTSKRLSNILNTKGYHTYSIKYGYEKIS